MKNKLKNGSLLLGFLFSLILRATDENIRVDVNKRYDDTHAEFSLYSQVTNEQIGTTAFTMFPKLRWFSLSRECYLNSIMVNKNFRNKGYGSLLLKKIIDHAIEQGCTKLELRVHPFNTTVDFCERKKELIEFYKKHGFKLEKTYEDEATMCSDFVYMQYKPSKKI